MILGLLGEDREGYGVGGGGVVAELEEEAGLWRAWEGEGVADEAFGDGGGVGEGGVGCDGVDEVEAGAGDGAGLGGVRGAVQVSEGGKADEGDQRQPVAGGAVGRYGPHAQGAKGGGAEGFERVEGGEEGVGVLQDEAAGLDGEGGVEGLVGVGDLELAGAREGRDGFEREGELLVGGEVVLICKMDGGVFRLADALAEKRD